MFKQYIKEGEKNLSLKKLSTLLKLQYGSEQDATLQLGDSAIIYNNFIEIQQYLYAC